MDAELRLVQNMAKSRYWQWMRTYLLARRDALIDTAAPSDALMHQNKGALMEIQQLLKGPELVIEYLTRQEASEAGEPAAPPQTEPLPGWMETAKQGGLTVE